MLHCALSGRLGVLDEEQMIEPDPALTAALGVGEPVTIAALVDRDPTNAEVRGRLRGVEPVVLGVRALAATGRCVADRADPD